MTKQQEFLDYLKNPTKARIRSAADCFLEGQWHGMITIHITQNIEQSCENEFSVEVIADNFGILLSTSLIFLNILKRFMKRAIITRRTDVDEPPDGTFKVTYYVTEV